MLFSILDAVRTNNPRVLKLLVAVHAGLKKRELNLALIHAVKSGYKDCSQILLCAGADPNARDQYDNSPLLLAAETGSYDITGLLLEGNASGCMLFHIFFLPPLALILLRKGQMRHHFDLAE